MKRTHIFLFLLSLTFLSSPLYAQESKESTQSASGKTSENIDKALNKAEQQLDKLINSFGKKKKKNRQAEGSTSADEAAVEAKAEQAPQHIPMEEAPHNTSPQQEHHQDVGSSSSASLTDIPPFPDETFDAGPFTEKGIVGKGPFGTKAAFWIKESHVSHETVKMEVHQLDTLTFDNFGQSQYLKSRHQQTVSMMGFNQKQNDYILSWTLGDSVFTLKEGEKAGIKMRNPGKEFYEGITEQQAEAFAEDLADATNTQLNRLGTQIVAGKRCEVWESETRNEEGIVVMRTRIWYWRGIAIQTHSRGMGIEEKTTTKEIKPLSRVDASTFHTPSHVSFNSLPFSFGN